MERRFLVVGPEFYVHLMSFCRTDVPVLKFSGSAAVVHLGFAKAFDMVNYRSYFQD